MANTEKKMWFAQKTYGYGSSMPISWEGWVVYGILTGGFFAVYWAAFHYFIGGEAAAILVAGMAVLFVPLIKICRDRTEGGWRWRWGDDD